MFEKAIHFLAYGVIIFSVVEVYLTLNKLWSRKHIKEVADSISISARATGMIPGTVFTLNYFFNQQWQGFIDGTIWIIASIIQILIAAGVWVAGNKKAGFIKLVRQSLEKETQEVFHLAKSFFNVKERKKIIDLLAATALTDQVLKDGEKAFVENLANEWGIQVSWEKLIARFKKEDVSALFLMSQEMHDYLRLNPSKQEIKLLLKLIKRLSDENGFSRPENQFIIDEFGEAFRHYPSTTFQEHYQVQIVPQQKSQHERLQASGVKMESKYIGSGFTYILRPFFTQAFADQVAQDFEELGYFAATKKVLAQDLKMVA